MHANLYLHRFLTCLALLFVQSARADNLERMDFSHWMRDLEDDTRLCDLSIVSTHDTLCTPGASGLAGYSSYAQTQSWSLATQLERGVRSLDIRVQKVHTDKWKFRIVHGEDIVYAVGYFGRDVLEVCAEFLRDHPSETIMMLVSQETSPSPPFLNPPSMGSILDRYINEDAWKDYIWRPEDKHYARSARLPDDAQGEIGVPDAAEENNAGEKLFPDAKWNDPMFPTLGEARGKIIIVHKKGKYGGGVGKRWYARDTDNRRWFGPMSGGDHYESGGGPPSKRSSTVWQNSRAYLRDKVDKDGLDGKSISGLMRRTGLNGQAKDALGLPYPRDAADFIQPRMFNFLFSGTGEGFGELADGETAFDDEGPDWVKNGHVGVLHVDYPRHRMVAAAMAYNFRKYSDPFDLMKSYSVPGLRNTTLFNEAVGGVWLSNNTFQNGESCQERAEAMQNFLRHVLPDHAFTVFCIKKGDDRSKFGRSVTLPRVGGDWKGSLHAGFVGNPLVVPDHDSIVAVMGVKQGNGASAFATQSELRTAVDRYVRNQMDQLLDPQSQAVSIRRHLEQRFADPSITDRAPYWGVVVKRGNANDVLGYRLRGTTMTSPVTHSIDGTPHTYYAWGMSGPRAPRVVTSAGNWTPGSLKSELSVALPGDTITFAPSMSGQTIWTSGTDINVNKDITIDASDLPDGITISGNNQSRVFNIASEVTATLRGLTIASGSADGAGGGIINDGHLTLEGCTLKNNYAGGNGGGISSNRFRTLVVRRSTIHGNESNSAGGGLHASGLTTIINSTLANNTAASNGGGALLGANATLHHVTVIGNTAPTTAGGGIYRSSGTVRIENSVIAQNTASTANNLSGTMTKINCHIGGDPMLAPLGDYGGPNETMPPLSGSPTIDSAPGIAGISTDQRGFARQSGSAVDLGAVERHPLIVTTSGGGAGSLRDQINQALPGDTVTFGDWLSGVTFSLGSPLVIDKDLTIDASPLPQAVIISGNNQQRVFEITSGQTVNLRGITITQGSADTGAGILSQGNLTIEDSTVAHNHATGQGGGIRNEGALTVLRSTISDNTAGARGAGIYSDGAGFSVAIVNSTMATNTAERAGGALYSGSASSSALVHATLVDNVSSSGWGGGIRNAGSTVSIENCIVAKNTASQGNNLSGTITQLGGNFVSNNDPMLAPLGNYGGPTMTVPPYPGSPAIDSAVGSGEPTDQRDSTRGVGGTSDLGAVEYQGGDDFLYFWDHDLNNDGIPLGLEHAFGYDPYDTMPPPPPHLESIQDAQGLGFQWSINPEAVPHMVWIVYRSPDLTEGSWVEIYRYDGRQQLETIQPGYDALYSGTAITLRDNVQPRPKRMFYRLRLHPAS